MKLYLVQHGEAAPKDVDPDRPLTPKGIADSQMAAAFLKKAGISIDAIWHSTKKRAMETAGIFAKDLSIEKVDQKDGLSPTDPVGDIFSDIKGLEDDIMIVGHLPFLQRLSSLALTGSEPDEIVRFKMAGCVCLEKDEKGKWQLIFEIIPDILKQSL